MFASLVVVFPIVHEGGALKIRHESNEWTVDSATVTEMDNTSGPVISYIAFYSDVEHEVTPVTSGHRVTLTWNLYLQPAVTLPDYSPSVYNPLVRPKASESELALKGAFTHSLSDIHFLPNGGYLAFGLHQEYPLDPDVGLGNLIDCLKGSDAIIQSVCHQLSLKTSLQIIYQEEDSENEEPGDFSLVDRFIDFERWESIDLLSSRIEEDGGRCIEKPRPVTVEGYHYYASPEEAPLLWVTDLTEYTRTKRPYLAHGNESSLGYSLHRLSHRPDRPISK